MTNYSKRFYSSLSCKTCGLKMTIPRRAGRKRKEGHIKTMYCAKCNEVKDFGEKNTITLADKEKGVKFD